MLQMHETDFFKPSITVSPYQLKQIRDRPTIHNIKRVSIERGSYDLIYSTGIKGTFKRVNIFTKKQLKKIRDPGFKLNDSLTFASKPVGIEEERKKKIIRNLVTLIPQEKRNFWENIPIMIN